MRHYLENIPEDLGKLLFHEAKMARVYDRLHPDVGLVYQPTYAEVFDWLLDKDIKIEINKYLDLEQKYFYIGHIVSQYPMCSTCPFRTWYEAANTIIEYAASLIIKKSNE